MLLISNFVKPGQALQFNSVLLNQDNLASSSAVIQGKKTKNVHEKIKVTLF